MIRTFALSLLFLVSVDCSKSSYFKEKIDRKDIVIAVLPFSGRSVSKSFTNLATDELSRLLFMNKYFQVVEQNQINYILRKTKLENSNVISREQFQLLADTLHANIIVLGKIEIFLLPSLHEEKLQHLMITLRIINGKNAAIIGMVHEKIITTHPLNRIIPEILNRMVQRF